MRGDWGEDMLLIEFRINIKLIMCMRFPTMWYFDMCRLGRASAASFLPLKRQEKCIWKCLLMSSAANNCLTSDWSMSTLFVIEASLSFQQKTFVAIGALRVKLSDSIWCSVSRILKRLAKALIRLRVCAGWSEALLAAHTTLLEIAWTGSDHFYIMEYLHWQFEPLECNLLEIGKPHLQWCLYKASLTLSTSISDSPPIKI